MTANRWNGDEGGSLEGRGPAVVGDPRPYPRRDPPHYFKNLRMIRGQIPRKNRRMMGDPIAQYPEVVQRPVCLPAGQRCAMRKHLAQRGPPQGHLVVRLAAGLQPATGAAAMNSGGRRGSWPPVLACRAGRAAGGSSSSNARGSWREDWPAMAGLVFTMGFVRISASGPSRSG